MANALHLEYPEHIRFVCNGCALCCGDTKQRRRNILLLETEVELISEKTGMNVDGFARRVISSEPYAYEMKKTGKGKCLFLKDSRCVIYASRPLVCKFYPFGLKNPKEGRYAFAYTDECPCIWTGPELGRDYFESLFSEASKLM